MHSSSVGGCTALVALVAAGCAHTVTVHTDPPGAEVSVDGVALGTAPVTFDERPGSAPHQVTARLDGYAPSSMMLERSELALWPALGLCAGSAACAALGCGTGALCANPGPLAGICGGLLVGLVNADLGCQTACAGCSLLGVAPSVWTAPGMTLGTVAGLSPLGALWGLGQSPDSVTVVLDAGDVLEGEQGFD